MAAAKARMMRCLSAPRMSVKEDAVTKDALGKVIHCFF